MSARTILITGCSSGIGLASARVMKARGWHVIATARRDDDRAKAHERQRVIGARCATEGG